MSNKHMLLHTSPSVHSEFVSSPFGEVETRCRPVVDKNYKDLSQMILHVVTNQHNTPSLPKQSSSNSGSAMSTIRYYFSFLLNCHLEE